jgi:hypothetical protein
MTCLESPIPIRAYKLTCGGRCLRAATSLAATERHADSAVKVGTANTSVSTFRNRSAKQSAENLFA